MVFVLSYKRELLFLNIYNTSEHYQKQYETLLQFLKQIITSLKI